MKTISLAVLALLLNNSYTEAITLERLNHVLEEVQLLGLGNSKAAEPDKAAKPKAAAKPDLHGGWMASKPWEKDKTGKEEPEVYKANELNTHHMSEEARQRAIDQQAAVDALPPAPKLLGHSFKIGDADRAEKAGGKFLFPPYVSPKYDKFGFPVFEKEDSGKFQDPAKKSSLAQKPTVIVVSDNEEAKAPAPAPPAPTPPPPPPPPVQQPEPPKEQPKEPAPSCGSGCCKKPTCPTCKPKPCPSCCVKSCPTCPCQQEKKEDCDCNKEESSHDEDNHEEEQGKKVAEQSKEKKVEPAAKKDEVEQGKKEMKQQEQDHEATDIIKKVSEIVKKIDQK